MKKMTFIAAATALVFASCSKDAPIETPNTGKEISFRTNLDKVDPTRAAQASTGTMTSFSAFAFTVYSGVETTGFDLMTENAVTRTQAGLWQPAKPTYWPETTSSDPKVTFVCYSPAGARNVYGPMGHVSGSNPYLAYKVPTTDQVDFLVGTQTVTPASGDYTNGGLNKVIIQFKHALAMAQFKALNQSDNTTFVITGISMLNIKNSGSLNYTLSSNLPAWTTVGSNTTFWSDYAASIPAAGVAVIYDPVNPLIPKLITTQNEGIMIMPQAVKTAAGTAPGADVINDGMYVSVTYYWIDGAFKRYAPKTVYYPLDAAIVANFLAGHKYIFNITFNAGRLVEFTDPVSSKWDAFTDTEI